MLCVFFIYPEGLSAASAVLILLALLGGGPLF